MLSLLIYSPCVAFTYYISNNGNDSNDGLSQSTPLKTLEALSAITFQAGDSILFASGDLFYGTLYVQVNSSVAKRLYFGIYNGTVQAIISGGVSITNWTLNGNIASSVSTDTVYALYAQTQRQIPARYPNYGYLNVTTVNSASAIGSDAFTQPDDYWNGAKVHIRTTPNLFETATVQQFNSSLLNLATSLTNTPPVGNGFYLDNHYQALDSSGEWFYDTNGNTLYYIPQNLADLSSGAIMAITKNYGILFNNSCDSITIENLEFRYQNNSAIYFASVANNVSILNNSFNYGNDAAIRGNAMTTNLQLLSNTFKDYLTNGIHFLQLWYSSVKQNEFEYIGVIAGQGRSGYFQYTPVFAGFMAYSEVSNNTIKQFGNSAIKTDGPFNAYKRNYIKDGMVCVTSSGALNFYGEICKELVIEDNFIFDIKGYQHALAQPDGFICGILLNAYCHNNTIRNNTLANAGNFGIWIATANYEHKIEKNLIYNSQRAQITLNDFYGVPGSNKDHIIKKNTFYSLSQKQAGIQYETFNASNALSVSDSNYYCNPYNYMAVRESYFVEEYITLEYPLPLWQKTVAKDTNSVALRIPLNQFAVNAETGQELIVNGAFTNNFDEWELQSDDGVQMLLDNETEMDGGCIKLLLQDKTIDFAQFYSSTFSLNNDAYYRLRYSVLGDKNSYQNASVYINGEDYRSVGLYRYVPYEQHRTERELLFKATEACASCGARFALYKGDSLLLMDNISLKEVSVYTLDSTKTNRLFINYSNQPITVNLFDTVYFDIKGNVVTGSLILPAYGSEVLIPQQTVYNTISEISEANQSIKIFPNPASDILYVLINSGVLSDCHLDILSMSGVRVNSMDIKTNQPIRISIADLSAGIYIIRAVADEAVQYAKFVKW